jgi:hypothetical protein
LQVDEPQKDKDHDDLRKHDGLILHDFHERAGSLCTFLNGPTRVHDARLTYSTMSNTVMKAIMKSRIASAGPFSLIAATT